MGHLSSNRASNEQTIRRNRQLPVCAVGLRCRNYHLPVSIESPASMQVEPQSTSAQAKSIIALLTFIAAIVAYIGRARARRRCRYRSGAAVVA
jgi:hypothetical protein